MGQLLVEGDCGSRPSLEMCAGARRIPTGGAHREKIAPVDLESAILTDSLFEQVMVLGEGRPHIAALAVINRERWRQQAAKLGLPADDPVSLCAPAIIEWVLRHIDSAVPGFPAYARPRAVFVSLEPWTIDSGLITPALKAKRQAIERRFAIEIAELYRGHELSGATSLRTDSSRVA